MRLANVKKPTVISEYVLINFVQFNFYLITRDFNFGIHFSSCSARKWEALVH